MTDIIHAPNQSLVALENSNQVKSFQCPTEHQPTLEDAAITDIPAMVEPLQSSNQPIEMNEDQMMEAFAKVYKTEAANIVIAKHNKDFWLESIAGRHRYAAFEQGIKAAFTHIAQCETSATPPVLTNR